MFVHVSPALMQTKVVKQRGLRSLNGFAETGKKALDSVWKETDLSRSTNGTRGFLRMTHEAKEDSSPNLIRRFDK